MQRLTKEELQKRIQDRWGNVNYEIISFGTAREPITIKCLDCGNTFTIKCRNNLFNKEKVHFCTYCSNTHKNYNNGIKSSMVYYEEAKQRIKNEFGNEYEIIEKSYKNWTTPCLIRHNCGKIFKTQPRYLFSHSHCPCLNIVSKGENKIIKILNKYNIKFEQQKRLDNMRRAPYDFFLPDYNLLIEFQGRQHFESVETFGGEQQLQIQKNIDERKKQNAENLGYSILYISYKQMTLIEEILVQRLSLTGVDSSESKY